MRVEIKIKRLPIYPSLLNYFSFIILKIDKILFKQKNQETFIKKSLLIYF